MVSNVQFKKAVLYGTHVQYKKAVVVDPDPVGSETFWPRRIVSRMIVPDPEMSFLTRKSVL